jgi:hypothetical protein
VTLRALRPATPAAALRNLRRVLLVFMGSFRKLRF